MAAVNLQGDALSAECNNLANRDTVPTVHRPPSSRNSTPLGIQNAGPPAEDDTGPDGTPVPDPVTGKRFKVYRGLTAAAGP